MTPMMPITKVITIFYGLNGIIVLLTPFDAVRQVRRLEARGQPADSDDAAQM